MRVPRLAVIALALAGFASPGVRAQQLLDRVIARVDSNTITLTDLQAAVGFAVVDPQAGDPLDALIDRRLIVVEMMRRPPAPPEPAVVDRELERMRQAAGARLSELMASTGVDEGRLRDIARETLMIQSYLEERFPVVAASDTDAEQYYKSNAAAFTRNGALRPFSEVAAEARRGAAAARRDARVAGWLGNLRNRLDVEIVPRP